jgi:acyl carrier protein
MPAEPPPEVLPASPLEQRIAQIVCELLEVAAVPVEQNLFDLGANSLDIVKLHAGVIEAFGYDLPIIDIFKHPTVRVLASRLSALIEGGQHV